MISPQPHILNYDFVRIEIFPNYMVSSFKEGIIFDHSHLEIICKIFDQYYPNKRFGYVSNRINDYTVNPTCYLKSSQYPLLLGMAVCCYTERSYQTAQFEKTFYKRPFMAFYAMEDAVDWIKTLLAEEAGVFSS